MAKKEIEDDELSYSPSVCRRIGEHIEGIANGRIIFTKKHNKKDKKPLTNKVESTENSSFVIPSNNQWEPRFSSPSQNLARGIVVCIVLSGGLLYILLSFMAKYGG